VTFLSDNRADLRKVTIPSLVLQCRDDLIAPHMVGRYVHEQIPGQPVHRARGQGHCPNISAPDQTVAAIRAFV